MDQRATRAGEDGSDDSSREPAHGAPPLSRRDFATRFGAGSAAAVGMAWASPHISTIRFAAKAAVGSPPPGSTTTTSTTIAGEEGSISISATTPCVGDVVTVHAKGFAPKTAVTLELDSPERTLGVTTAGAAGRINVTVRLPANVTGAHQLLAVGVRAGGRTLSLSTPITIKTAEECAVGPQGTTSTSTTPTTGPTTATTSSTATTTPTTAPPVKENQTPEPPSKAAGNGGLLAFTGTDSVDLALLGAAAAVGGRALFGLVAHRDDDEDDEE